MQFDHPHLQLSTKEYVFLCFDLFPCVFIDSKIFFLFLIHVDSALFGKLYFITIWDLDDSFSILFKAVHFSLIDFVLSFFFAATVSIVKFKQNDLGLNLQDLMHAMVSYNSIRISKSNIQILLTLQCKVFMKPYINLMSL